MRKIDHIVYCVHNLEESIPILESILGVSFSPGGRHLTEGTKNVLLNLGGACYLEILAIDTENQEVSAPRWMGVDLLTEPQVTRWALKTSNPHSDAEIVKAYNPDMGIIKPGQRITSSGAKLEWDLVMPLASPAIEVMPFMTDWSKSDVHPTDSLPERCTLESIELQHPNPDLVKPYLDRLVDNIDLKKGSQASIKIHISCPNGIVTI